MPIVDQGEVTRLLDEVAAGNDAAKQELFAVVYEELRQKAYARIQGRPNHTLGVTGLAHEVYLQLMRSQLVFSKNRAYFFGAAGRAMNQILGDYARKKDRSPPIDSGGYLLLDAIAEEVENTLGVDLLDLMDALDKLKALGEYGGRRFNVVTLRFWGGLTFQEIAEHLEVSLSAVERDWQAARAWLYGQLKGGRTDA